MPPTAKITANRLTFASFPIIGYSLTSDTVPQTQLWEMATYDIKPRLNRLDGVSTVMVQGGQEPEFQITPDPAKLLRDTVTVTDILDADRRARNLIDSPGLFERNHQLVLGLVSGQVRNAERSAEHRHQEHARGYSGAHRRRGHGRSQSVKPVYTVVTRQRQAGRAAQHQSPARQQHRGGGERSARRN